MSDIINVFFRYLVVASVLLQLVSCGKNEGSAGFTVRDEKIVISSGDQEYIFSPKFTVLYRADDPKLAMRKSGIDGVSYNVITWLTHEGEKGDLADIERDESQAGDGFDPSVLDAKKENRTPNFYKSGQYIIQEASEVLERGDSVVFQFEEHDLFALKASVTYSDNGYPLLGYSLIPKVAGYFSVGYSGAPTFNVDKVEEIWQPLIWQEKRFPTSSYMTLALRCPIPTTMVNDGQNTIGVLAAPEEFPFDPLPLVDNSRFGIVLRDFDGKAKPQLFAPVLGGQESQMKPGDVFSFSSYLLVEQQSITGTYEKIARQFFDFRDYRHNEFASLNETFENIVEYSKSDYSRYVDSLKGFAYSTDVPGAVKNVSSLNPLEIALVTDDQEVFDTKAYPMMEYMMSREKFLFSLDPEQKIQHPSRKLTGPIAPISELVALYNIFGQSNDFLAELAKTELTKARVRNLDVAETGENWMNYMHLYSATGDKQHIDKAVEGAKAYLERRVDKRQGDFKDPLSGGPFFWTGFTNRWIELTQLYEITKDEAFLNAARDGARHYAMFIWMSPRIPDTNILVNEGGKAPLYWYLRSKGHEQMYYPEERVEAWRLSEIGLTPESSGTSNGHRAIFMANYAPWMLRLGYYTNDVFLKEIAKSAIIGRYRNFPGYHINTARTTAYEKEDYPYHEHKELSVNSFHYNHIMPMASMLLDYLVTDVFVRSKGAIHFPAEYIEGYAYLRNKFYGAKEGEFYGEKGVQLWMPRKLLAVDNVELNYITARKDGKLYIAFTNQSSQAEQAQVTLNPEYVEKTSFTGKIWKDNVDEGVFSASGSFDVEVSPDGITAIVIDGVELKKGFQQSVLASTKEIKNSYKELAFGNTRAMVFNLGEYAQSAYIYLQDDDSVWSRVSLTYKDADGGEKTISDQDYPFEFTIPLDRSKLEFRVEGKSINGPVSKSEWEILGE